VVARPRFDGVYEDLGYSFMGNFVVVGHLATVRVPHLRLPYRPVELARLIRSWPPDDFPQMSTAVECSIGNSISILSMR
jgi:hypothetical protein